MKIEIYTDGSATTLGNPGGWASVIVLDGQKHKELSGYMESATNNDAELLAAIKGLEFALEMLCATEELYNDTDVTLCSDSKLVLGWASGEFRFKQENKMESYHTLTKLVRKMRVKTRWIEGHSGDEHNERCDKLANMARKKIIEDGTKLVPKSRLESKIGTKKAHVVSIWYGDELKVIDFETGVIENYNREAHGKRGSVFQVRDCKNR